MDEIEQGALRERMSDLLVRISAAGGAEIRLAVDPAQTLTLLGRLRDDPETSMRRLVDLTAIDRGPRVAKGARFEIVYRLHSPNLNLRMRIHAPLDGPQPSVDSAVALWPAADWLEREVFDLFGIHFRGHPDLRRLLLSADFDGHPLRKDYPRQPNLALPKASDR